MKTINAGRTIVVIITAAVFLTGMVTARSDDQKDLNAGVTNQTPEASPGQAQDANSELTSRSQGRDDHQPAPSLFNGQGKFNFQYTEPYREKRQAREVAWLGLGVDESTDVLSSQLGLKPGEGLTVNFLATNSPAAKAGFHKNDVLVELDGQMLVHPLQFRKLVQMHTEGDTIKLVFYRGGKKMTVSVKLGKMTPDQMFGAEDGQLPGDLQNLRFQLGGLSGQWRGMSDSMSRLGQDKARINTEVQRAVEQARNAIEDAARRVSAEKKTMTSVDHDLQALARYGVDVANDATVTVRDKHNSSRTIVRTDENGSLIIEAGAQTHLTAHDKDGRSLFDGDISTPAEQEKVPKEVWARAKPMFDQLH
jgi:hypothetical protein